MLIDVADGDIDLLVSTWNRDARSFPTVGSADELRCEPYPFELPLPPIASPALANLDGS